MKNARNKLFALMLVCVILVTGCSGRADTSEKAGSKSKHGLDGLGKDAPSEQTIVNDLEKSLSAKNEHASLTDVATVKSLTEDDSFGITLQVTANTKYARWNYQAVMKYTEYDQGWMMDSVTWDDGSVEVTSIPDADAMTEYIKGYLPTHEVYEDHKDHGVLNIKDITVEAIDDEVLAEQKKEDGTNYEGIGYIMAFWTSEDTDVYTTTVYDYSSAWEYDADIDHWILVQESEENKSNSAHYAFYEDEQDCRINSLKNLDGTYTGDTPWRMPAEIVITNYTTESFDVSAKWELADISGMYVTGSGEYRTASDHFVLDETKWIIDGTTIPYISERGSTFEIYYGADAIYLEYDAMCDGEKLNLSATIKGSLPDLTETE